MHALKLEGTAEVRQADFSEAVVCVGGPQVLLPLFAQLDLPFAEGSDEGGRPASDPAEAAAALELVAAALRHPLAAQVRERESANVRCSVLMFLDRQCWRATAFT